MSPVKSWNSPPCGLFRSGNGFAFRIVQITIRRAGIERRVVPALHRNRADGDDYTMDRDTEFVAFECPGKRVTHNYS